MPQPNVSVFICGTYADLREERTRVIDAVKRMELRSGSMEIFGARPEAPIDVCLAEVRKSDVLVVILGHRYGALVPGKETSFTEAEYEEGYRLSKASFVYMRGDDMPVVPLHYEQDEKKISRLKQFKTLLEERHTVYHYKDVSELALQVTVDLSRSLTKIGSLDSAMEMLRRGVDSWNLWRSTRMSEQVNFENVNLGSLSLEGFNFSGLNLVGANFVASQLRGANFEHSNLIGVNFCDADISLVQFEKANLSKTIFRGSNLSGASLRNAVLEEALIVKSDLSRSNFSGAELRETVIAMSDLSSATGLDQCIHHGPGSIDFASLIKAQDIPEVFLRGIGVPPVAIDARHSYTPSAVQFFSCFISYSTADQDFANRLHADLQSSGVSCWFAPHNIRAGSKIYEQIDEAIGVYDRLLLILSESSISSMWVQTEISKARSREVREKRLVLLPIRLIPFSELIGWQAFDADTGRDQAREIREYFIPDFSNWKDYDSYRKAFEQLLRDLKADNNN